ncbi:TadE/TadG family type IV pilus assembly protein [Lentzea sp. NPDC006480]|uniref:TadE/TadG family type IV pilus assembly protein n=1 Tax=Lentzea sp. NPDC006480 TaxID=3157176 RepID=UPI0033B8B824
MISRLEDDGSVAAEFALVTPLLIALTLLIAGSGSLANTKLCVNDAAHQAARAASLSRETQTATSEGRSVAEASLAAAGAHCRSVQVDVAAADLRPGGAVSATVSCTIDLPGMAFLGIAVAHTITATSTSVVDRYRGTGAP